MRFAETCGETLQRYQRRLLAGCRRSVLPLGYSDVITMFVAVCLSKAISTEGDAVLRNRKKASIASLVTVISPPDSDRASDRTSR